MAFPRSITEGPTIPCPVCGVTIRNVYNPHNDEYTTYHGEDLLTTAIITGAGPLTDAEAIVASTTMLGALLTQLIALHGLDA